MNSLSLVCASERIVRLAPTMHLEQLLSAGTRDVATFLSFPRYPNITIAAAAHAQERGVQLVVLTDSALSPLAPLATCALFAHSQLHSFTESIAAPINVAQTLVTAVAVSNRKAATRRLKALETEWGETHVYHSSDQESIVVPLPSTRRRPQS